MSDEKMRAEFEAWHRSAFSFGSYSGQPTRDKHNGEYSDRYNVPAQQERWEAWQASRKALCVELPGPVKGERSFPGSLITSAYNGLLSACKEALDKAGVSYK
ncbi:MAG: hypothetical protein Tp138OMZ00d2C19078221_58 [Prokaryotic dsDNA virus sp.]|jgi:hypothetical protein|nr:hypothetical protein [Pseudomonadales bacterium]QDP67486.1 MAG: hypothetical protein Tp138OMZ00d2C19078221_58 [Prokaryotic dsDNA virus sp.]|tara:strand:- start:26174 stop:26479 length:306 start_codon:yes stop_codon:yes gene_type:complete